MLLATMQCSRSYDMFKGKDSEDSGKEPRQTDGEDDEEERLNSNEQ